MSGVAAIIVLFKESVGCGFEGLRVKLDQGIVHNVHILCKVDKMERNCIC